MKITMTDFGVSGNIVYVAGLGPGPSCVLPSPLRFIWQFPLALKFLCLFELMLSVPVNSYGHVGTLPPYYGTYTQN